MKCIKSSYTGPIDYYRHRQDLGGGVTESCVVEIIRPNCKKLLVWTVYRAPNTNLEGAIEEIQDRLLNILIRPN